MVTLLLNDEVTQFSFKHENGRSRVISTRCTGGRPPHRSRESAI
jgi:hypothetical protein